MKKAFFIFLHFGVCLLNSCTTSTTEIPTAKKEITVEQDSSDLLFDTYLSKFEIKGNEISKELVRAFILPLIEQNHGYNDAYLYRSDTIFYQNDNFIAVQFSLVDEDVEVTFLSTLDLKTKQPIGAISVEADVYMEQYYGKGYNTYYTINTLSVTDDSLAHPIVLTCQENRTFENFNTELYSTAEIQELEKGETRKRQYLIDTVGIIEEIEL